MVISYNHDVKKQQKLTKLRDIQDKLNASLSLKTHFIS